MNSLILDKSFISFRLKVFWSVAKHLSFTKAAKELFISQPAISKHIRELELEKGLQFFYRKGNTISLTQAGKRLYAYAEELFSLYYSLDRELNELKNPEYKRFAIGAGTSLAQYHLPAVLSQFRVAHPNEQLILVNGNSREITEKIKNGELDIGIVETREPDAALHYELFTQEPVLAVMNSQRPVVNSDNFSLHQLPHVPLLMRKKGSGTRKSIQISLDSNGIAWDDLQIRMEFDSPVALKNYLLADDSLGFLPLHVVRQELEWGQLAILPILDFSPTRTYHFVYREDHKRELIRAFTHFVRSSG